MRAVGLGLYHTGVEIGGLEYTFAQQGIFFHQPKAPPTAPGQSLTHKESIVMGSHHGSANDVHACINR